MNKICKRIYVIFIAVMMAIPSMMSILYMTKGFHTQTAYLQFIFFDNQITRRIVLVIFLMVLFQLGYICLVEKKYQYVWESIQNNKAILFFIGFPLWIIIASLLNGLSAYTLVGDSYQNESMFSFLYYILVLFMGCCCIRSDKVKRILINIFLISSFFVIGYASIYMMLKTNTPMDKVLQHTIGVFSQHNHYGYYLTLVITLSASMYRYTESKYEKVLYMNVFLLNTIILQFNDTFGAWLAVFTTLLIQFLYYLSREKRMDKIVFVQLGLFLLITFLISFMNHSILTSVHTTFMDVGKIAKNTEDAGNAGTGRWRLWTNTSKLIIKKPIFGYGVKGVNAMIAPGGDSPHNELLEYASTFGVTAVILYLCGIFTIVTTTLKSNNQLSKAILISVIGYFISSLFGNTWYYTTPYFFILMGFCYSGVISPVE